MIIEGGKMYQIPHKGSKMMTTEGKADTVLKCSMSVSAISRMKTMTYEGEVM